MMEILYIVPIVLTSLYFCLSSNAHKMVQSIYEDEGIFATILIVILCIGCWQLFWIIRFNPSIADKLKA